MSALRTLAAFKRALTVGSQWEFRFSAVVTSATGAREAVISDWQPRTVVRRQTNAVAFAKSFGPAVIAAATARPHACASWLWFPKAESCRFFDDGVVRLGETDADHWIEYRLAVMADPRDDPPEPGREAAPRVRDSGAEIG